MLVWLGICSAPSALLASAWSTSEPLQVARQEVAVAELDGRVYVVGGLVGGTVLSSVEVYDPTSDSWSFAAPLPTGIHHTAAVSSGGRLYVMGGWTDFFANATANLWAYDPSTDAWSARAPLPAARASLAAAALGGKIYAAGGWPLARSADFAVYDPTADAWSVLPDLPTPRNHLGAATLGGVFYALGGRSSLGAGVGNLDAVESFDPATGVWTARPALPTARSGLAVVTVGSFVLVLGGEGNDANPDGTFAEVRALEPRRGDYRTLEPLPTPVHGIGAALLAGRVYVPGGAPVEGFGLTDLNQVYDPGLDPAFPLAIPALGGLASVLLGALLLAGGVLLRSRQRRV